MTEITHVYIDAGYFKEVFRETIQTVFGLQYEPDYAAIIRSYNARRAYFYDCIDNIPRRDETEEDLNARIQGQEDYLDSIDSIKGLHVRRGHLKSGRRKREQKEVDVLLAVDMMEHSFNRVITKAVLISGDRDFRPVVESLVRTGTFVEVRYRLNTGAKELGKAADLMVPLSTTQLIDWVKLDAGVDRSAIFPGLHLHQGPPSHVLRHMRGNRNELKARAVIARGKTSTELTLFSPSPGNDVHFLAVSQDKEDSFYCSSRDLGLLYKIVETDYGAVEWDTF